MSFVFDLLSSINNPNQEASVDQLGQLTGGMKELASSNGLDLGNMENLLGGLGGMLRPALKEQAGNGNMLENMLGQATGGGTGALGSLITPQLIEGLAAKTGIKASMLTGLIPTLLPMVMGLLNMGKTKDGMGGNPLLTSFLNSNQGGDLGNAFKIANRFLNPPQ